MLVSCPAPFLCPLRKKSGKAKASSWFSDVSKHRFVSVATEHLDYQPFIGCGSRRSCASLLTGRDGFYYFQRGLDSLCVTSYCPALVIFFVDVLDSLIVIVVCLLELDRG